MDFVVNKAGASGDLYLDDVFVAAVTAPHTLTGLSLNCKYTWRIDDGDDHNFKVVAARMKSDMPTHMAPASGPHQYYGYGIGPYGYGRYGYGT